MPSSYLTYLYEGVSVERSDLTIAQAETVIQDPGAQGATGSDKTRVNLLAFKELRRISGGRTGVGLQECVKIFVTAS
jgi:hypothetical protein